MGLWLDPLWVSSILSPTKKNKMSRANVQMSPTLGVVGEAIFSPQTFAKII